MSTKRIMRWVIVLFLLAALPGLTAVMAQGQEPGTPQSPATWNVYESEPNDNRDSADIIGLNDVVGGVVMYWDDPEIDTCNQDFYRFNMPQAGYVLIDIDTDSIGSRLDPTVTLYRPVGEYLEYLSSIYVFDLETEPLLFYALTAGTYYIYVNDYENEYCGPDYYYELTLSSPLLVSAAAAKLGTGMVAGISFQSQDILAFSDLNNGQEKWVMFFDGSDVGITTNVTNIAGETGDRLLISLAANRTLPGVGVVTPWDVVIFDPDQYGMETSGSFQWGFHGRLNDLTTAAEKLDAVDDFDEAPGPGNLLVSTTGTAVVPYYMGYNLKPKDEDVFTWAQYNEEWYDFFLGNHVQGLGTEDVYAAAHNESNDLLYMTILGTGNILGHRVNQKDIFAIHRFSDTWGGLVWHGPDHGWNYNIDAFEWSGW